MKSTLQEVGSVSEQLEKIRHDYKTLKIWVFLQSLCLFFGLVLFSLYLQQTRSPQIITAEALYVEDANGTTRAYLGTFGESTYLHLNDAKGDTQATLSADLSGPSLSLHYGEPRKIRTLLSARTAGTSLSFVDASGKSRAVLKVETQPEQTPTGEQRQEAALILYDKDGHTLFTAP